MKIKHINLIILIIFSFISCNITNSSDEEESFIFIQLSMDKTELQINEIPLLTAKFTNNFDYSIYLYHYYETGYYPLRYIQISKANSDEIIEYKSIVGLHPRYQLNLEHFIYLEPNKSMMLFEKSEDLISANYMSLLNAGNYKMKFVLNYNESNYYSWAENAPDDPKIIDLFDRIPKEIFYSNEIMFTVR